MISSSFPIVAYLYWMTLLVVTSGSLVFAILAFRRQRLQFAAIAAGALAAALMIAALPSPGGATVSGVLLGMLALGLAVVGGGPAALLALRLATNNSVPQGQHGGILVENGAPVAPIAPEPAPTDAPAAAGTEDAPGAPGAHGARGAFVHEVLRGGLMIGILERLAVAGAILAGFPEAIAVVVAIKGVGRFTELATAEARERFIIGTLASLIWACACAALVQIALT
ncbi:hypothetical protein E3T28_00560 [Cryobacterium sinapicolor]|uniref:Uncharacterized protein n=1 Tax=Cryobacterium sinapicolor TaxID=1259236 RepID=A0ABY2JH81_9MICO|nr:MULTISPECIES: hypothetical protein [Cryobacterium]TFC88213.1 hypothetical protein E3O67_08115 [Cryobacterium sp. TMT3-29-2]TFD05267.1 hypothetical protein E3T28_00560 [Cryobacterium sinapicolor]